MKAKQSGVMSNSGGPGNVGAAVSSTNAISRWQPGMEQFVNAIKFKSTKNK